MGLLLLVLLLLLLFGGIAVSAHIIWIIAIVLIVCLCLGNFAGPRGGGGWYRWR